MLLPLHQTQGNLCGLFGAGVMGTFSQEKPYLLLCYSDLALLPFQHKTVLHIVSQG